MASSSSPARAPNRSQRDRSSFYEYETRSSDLARDRGFFESADGRRAFQPAHNIGVKRRRVRPSDLVDAFGDWVPLPGEAEGELDPEESLPNADLGDKRKRYLSSDDPMALWRLQRQLFFNEMLRHDGLGDALDDKACSCCRRAYTRPLRRFRCTDCG
ncbi:hypothetical protein C8F04DRAFT_1201746, partial [Mycena alexandri]